MSWPNLKEQRLCGFKFEPRRFNKEECLNPETICEIIMVDTSYGSIAYDHKVVPLVVSYDTEFGEHIILFSKIRNLYVSEYYLKSVISDDVYYQTHQFEGDYVSTEELNAIFWNMVAEVKNLPVRGKLYYES